MAIHPVILCGGSGTRLWPLSRRHYPKQLLSLTAEGSLLQETLGRLDGGNFEPALVICNADHRFMVAEQVRRTDINIRGILVEPVGRNTAAAAAIAAMTMASDDIILLLPSDHLIGNRQAFLDAIETAAVAAGNDYLTTFGIVPTRPETGYGYILAGKAIAAAPGCFRVEQFIEKPDSENAARMIAAGGHVWNSGIFMFRAGLYLGELDRLQPDISAACARSMERMSRDRDFSHIDNETFTVCPALSIDHAVMEHTRTAAVVPVDMGWSDIGSWSELWNVADKDDDGNVVTGDVLAEKTTGSYLRSEGRMIAALGVRDMVVVDTGDAVLVASMAETGNMAAIIDRLDRAGRTEHLLPARVRRPWGWYQSLDRGPSFQVKMICVNPAARLSLQRHRRRSEHWVVVSGRGLVHCDGKETTLGPDQSAYIPAGAVHRIENTGDRPLHLIEVQSGDYLGEDDIERLEDDFGRT